MFFSFCSSLRRKSNSLFFAYKDIFENAYFRLCKSLRFFLIRLILVIRPWIVLKYHIAFPKSCTMLIHKPSIHSSIRTSIRNIRKIVSICFCMLVLSTVSTDLKKKTCNFLCTEFKNKMYTQCTKIHVLK